MTKALVKSVYMVVPAAVVGMVFAGIPSVALADHTAAEMQAAWDAAKAAEDAEWDAEQAEQLAQLEYTLAQYVYDGCSADPNCDLDRAAQNLQEKTWEYSLAMEARDNAEGAVIDDWDYYFQIS
ncbi:MAG TPA: hypothetical protein VG839_04975 [Asticcacaulis sp.]|nr:hypothetical protein [Asticcacaulis sp.]